MILHPSSNSLNEIVSGGVILMAFGSYNNQNRINPLSMASRTILFVISALDVIADKSPLSWNIFYNTRWEYEVTKDKLHYHLTLSGHTHGMQFGIEIPGLVKWSPIKWRYKYWAGLYKQAGQYLNVNRGFGFLAFPCA